MKKVRTPNLFISYSHKNENDIEEFIKYLAPLKNKGLISEWYDRKIIAGQDFRKIINDELENTDIICLFVSADFLSSSECMQEKDNAIKLRKKKGVSVISIILSDCGWEDDDEISSLLVLPTDGNAVSDYKKSDTAWKIVYKGLKPIIEKEGLIAQLEISEQFQNFIQDTELLTKTHPEKEELLLDDIFIYPKLVKYDDFIEYERIEDSEKLIKDFDNYSKILIAGEDQSGKTALCKKFYTELRQKNFVPIYLGDQEKKFQGRIENRISKAFKEQYKEIIDLREIEKERIVLLIDDFHFAQDKEKFLDALKLYPYQIITVDDIFELNFRDETLANSYERFKIQEYTPSQRYALIKKWVQLVNFDHTITDDNIIYQNIDHITEVVNSALGKIMGRGIMPAYPFFILMVINAHQISARPLDQEITSQGYCYQALIYIYLRKQGVKNDEIDTYVNFLTELSFYLYQKQKKELSCNDFDDFIRYYKNTFNLSIAENILLSNLQKTNIFSRDSFNNYSFNYSYLYLFFVAKYFADHLDDNKDKIVEIMNNLHNNDNAYISSFISHHSKNTFILDQIITTASSLFEKYIPLTFTSHELDFFDKEIDNILEAFLPQRSTTPEKERDKDLKIKDNLEDMNERKEENIEENTDLNELVLELRRSVRTVEVMGTIIKNRAGSLENDKLESVFESGMKVHLRLLQSFIDLIRNKKKQQGIIDFISRKIDIKMKDRKNEPNQEMLERWSKQIFWNMNFGVLYGFINKTIRSLGSNQLLQIVERVSQKENTPAAFLIMHGILMWYSKNLQLDDIINRIESDDFSKIAKRIMKHQIVNHCRLHRIGYQERDKIQNQLNIPTRHLLRRNQE